MTIHRIALADFSEGRVLCESPCSVLLEVVAEPAFDRNERLVNAWMEHRRGDGKSHPISYDRDGRPQGFRLKGGGR